MMEPVEKEYQNLSDLNSYQNLVDTAAEKNSSDTLPNAGPLHAAVAMSKLFDKTVDIARMVVGSFSGHVCDQDNYLQSLGSAIERDVTFQVIFLNPANQMSQAYQLLKDSEKKGKKISFKNASQNFIDLLSKDNKPKHFAVFDNNKFRFESDANNFVAFFSFNNKPNAELLLDIFNSEFQK